MMVMNPHKKHKQIQGEKYGLKLLGTVSSRDGTKSSPCSPAQNESHQAIASGLVLGLDPS